MDRIEDLRDEDGRLAYAVRGAGQPLVFVPDLLLPIDALDEDPPFAQLLESLASFSRLVIFDRRGIGFSDPVPDDGRPIFDTWARDIARVITGVIGEPAVVFGSGFLSGPSALRAAQLTPGLVRHLILMNTTKVSPDSTAGTEVVRNIDGESEFDFGAVMMPSRHGDAVFERWMDRAGRRGASPAAARRIWEAVARSQSLLDATGVTVPTTAFIRSQLHWQTAATGARELVGAIPQATVVELSGTDVFAHCGDVDEVVHAAAAVMGADQVRSSGPTLLTLLFSDIVASTERSGEVGNARWRSLLDEHDEVASNVVTRHGGTLVKHTGDGVLATFPTPSRALRAARALRDDLARSDLAVRIGLHTAEVERRGEDVNGVGVNVAARIMNEAAPGEILVSAAVPLIVAGAPFGFASRGERALKGLAGPFEVFALVDTD